MKKEPLISPPQRSYLRTTLSVLSESCHLDQGHSFNCPFYEVRDCGRKERMAWLVRLSDESMLSIHAYCHLCCKKEQENKQVDAEEDSSGLADSLQVASFSSPGI